MADTRTCYAGDLNSDTLGKRVDLGDGVVVGPVTEIRHRESPSGTKTTRIVSDTETHQLYDTATVQVRASTPTNATNA